MTAAAMLSLAACQRTSTISYKVKNIAADSLRIISARMDAPTGVADTFYISYNQTVTIAIVDKGSGHVSNYKQANTVLEDLRSVEINRIGWHYTNGRSILASGKWTYVETGDHSADYVAVVTEKDL